MEGKKNMEAKKNTEGKRNPKVTRGGSSRPRVQSQPVYRPQMYEPQPVYPSHPQMYESSSQHVYRPQMYEPQSPQMFYTQHPLPQLPTNFNPFEPRIYQPKKREHLKAPLPIPDDDDDDDDFFDQVDMIPETQPNNEAEEVEAEEQVDAIEVQEVAPEFHSRPKKAEKKHWSPEEKEALAKSWIKVSTDKEVGDRQTKEGFWKRVLKHFQSLIPGTARTKDLSHPKNIDFCG